MSVAVSLEALAARIAEFGPHPYLVTAGAQGGPHVVSVTARVDGDHLVVEAGNTSRANVAANAAATLLWPAPAGEDYSLIVDGEGEPPEAQDRPLVVRPTKAVLHRVANASDDLPSCIRIGEDEEPSR